MRAKTLLLTVAVLTCCTAKVATGTVEDDADKAAQKWLGLVDAAKYEKSWEIAAPTFKKVMSKEGWKKIAIAVRGPLGQLKSRKLKSATATKTLPGAPDGNYVVLQYTSSFEHKADAVETVTPALGVNKVWQVSGYQIK